MGAFGILHLVCLPTVLQPLQAQALALFTVHKDAIKWAMGITPFVVVYDTSAVPAIGFVMLAVQ